MRLIYPPLIDRYSIQSRIEKLAEEIVGRNTPETLEVLIVLNGALFFSADLLRCLPPVNAIDFFKLSSYRGKESSGKMDSKLFPSGSYENKNLLLIEDILDTGLTTTFILEWLQQFNPKSIQLCVLLVKNNPNTRNLPVADYVGFHIDNHFVVGYGMDYNGMYRNLPDIHVLEFE